MSTSSTPTKYGRIELIIGPMFASKSTELIKASNRYKSINKKILAINHIINSRYDCSDIITHDKNVLQPCVRTDSLMSLIETPAYIEADIIIIEELQFFKDAFEFITQSADKYGKTVIGAGLSGDYKREPFGDVLRLIPHADRVKMLKAFCKPCAEHGGEVVAHFVKKVCKEEGQILVGGEELFIPVCRKHYLE
jgi:thymidine kinase